MFGKLFNFINQLISWWTVIAVVGVGVAVELWRFVYHAPHYAQGLFAFAVALDLVLLIRDRKRNLSRLRRFLDDLRQPPMEAEHEEHLRNIARYVQSSVQGAHAVSYGGSVNERDFKEHFPGLVPLIDPWNSILQTEQSASGQARASIQ